MKLTHSIHIAALAAAIGFATVAAAHAQENGSGKVDFGTFTPPASGGEFVEVKVGGSLISMAAKLIGKQEPEIAKMISGLRSIQVSVVGIDEANRSELQDRAKSIGKKLVDSGWERIVTAQNKGQDVGIYMKSRAKDFVEGLTVVVLEGAKQAVFINVDGDIKPEQLAELGVRFQIDPLKELNLPKAPEKSGDKAEEETGTRS